VSYPAINQRFHKTRGARRTDTDVVSSSPWLQRMNLARGSVTSCCGNCGLTPSGPLLAVAADNYQGE